MMFEQGEVVLIPIPFTDLSSRKRRPVIIVSNSWHAPRPDRGAVAGVSSTHYHPDGAT